MPVPVLVLGPRLGSGSRLGSGRPPLEACGKDVLLLTGDGRARVDHGLVGGLQVRLALRVANHGGVLLNLLEVTAGDDGVANEAEEAAEARRCPQGQLRRAACVCERRAADAIGWSTVPAS